MTYARDAFDNLPQLPAWVTSARAETPEDVAFLSGAALSHLYLVLRNEAVPQALLRERLALRSAAVCMTRQGRPERAGELRDAVAFLQPGDSAGPAGETYLAWLRAVERPISVSALHRALPQFDAADLAVWLDGAPSSGAGDAAPITRAAGVIEAVLRDHPRAQIAALLLADATLAQALRWTHVVPLMALGMKRKDLGPSGDDLRPACHRAIVKAVPEAIRLAADLTRRAAKLQDVAPKLRAKGAADAITLFLTRDAAAPTALTSLRSDRAARRFCDRLVDLGAVRELTGRDTFRLYGV